MADKRWARLWRGLRRFRARKAKEGAAGNPDFSPEGLEKFLTDHGLKLTERGRAAVYGPSFDPTERFRRNLVGHWYLVGDSSMMVGNDHWTYRPDGTGEYIRTGLFGYPQWRVRFVWEEVADFEIRVRALGPPEEYISEEEGYAPYPDAEEDPDQEQMAKEWQSYPYRFSVSRHGDFSLRGMLPLFPYLFTDGEREGLHFGGEWDEG